MQSIVQEVRLRQCKNDLRLINVKDHDQDHFRGRSDVPKGKFYVSN